MRQYRRFTPFAAATAFALVSLLVTEATAAPVFGSYKIGLGWPVSFVNLSADWSSDLGADYRYSLYGGGNGAVTASGPILPDAQNFSADFALDIKGGAAGATFSEGEIDIPPSGALDPNALHHFRMRSVLGANSDGYGISTGTSTVGYWSFPGASGSEPVYWALQYTLNWSSIGSTYGIVAVNGLDDPHNPQPRRPLIGTFASNNFDILPAAITAGSGSLSATHFGSWTSTYIGWNLETMIEDYSGSPGQGEVELEAWLAFSTTPFTSFPQSSAPAPDAIALIGVGLVGLAASRRRPAISQRADVTRST